MERKENTSHLAQVQYPTTQVKLELRTEERPVQPSTKHRKQSIPLYLYERKLSKPAELQADQKPAELEADRKPAELQADRKPAELQVDRKPSLAALKDKNVTRICISSASPNQRYSLKH